MQSPSSPPFLTQPPTPYPSTKRSSPSSLRLNTSRSAVRVFHCACTVSPFVVCAQFLPFVCAQFPLSLCVHSLFSFRCACTVSLSLFILLSLCVHSFSFRCVCTVYSPFVVCAQFILLSLCVHSFSFRCVCTVYSPFVVCAQFILLSLCVHSLFSFRCVCTVTFLSVLSVTNKCAHMRECNPD